MDGHPWQEWYDAEAHAASDGRMPGAPSRWNAKKDLSWEPLKASRVIEVAYEHMQGNRFRHATRMLRWRDDKTPARMHVRAVGDRGAVRVDVDPRSLTSAPTDSGTIAVAIETSAADPRVETRRPKDLIEVEILSALRDEVDAQSTD